jgi:iron complex transport system ATP-binding protein
MAEALRIRHVTVKRGSRVVLDDVSVAADSGAILAVIGPNGAGKTTLLDAIAGFHPFAGDITLQGRSLAALSRGERAQKLAYVPQASKLESAMLVRDVVGQGRFAHRDSLTGERRSDRAAVADALAATDTTRFAGRAFTALSLGERRRVLVARALATGARTILLDEPSASLDIGQSLALFALLRRLADDGYTLVVVLHQLDEVVRCADQALLLQAGRTIACGPTAEVITLDPVRRVYQVDLVPHGGLGYRRAGELG